MGVICVNRRHVSHDIDSVNSSWNHTVRCVADLTHIKVTLWHTYRAGVAMWTTSFLRNSVRIVRNGMYIVCMYMQNMVCSKTKNDDYSCCRNQPEPAQIKTTRVTTTKQRKGDFESETTQSESETSITLIQSGRGGCDESNQRDGHSIRFYC